MASATAALGGAPTVNAGFFDVIGDIVRVGGGIVKGFGRGGPIGAIGGGIGALGGRGGSRVQERPPIRTLGPTAGRDPCAPLGRCKGALIFGQCIGGCALVPGTGPISPGAPQPRTPGFGPGELPVAPGGGAPSGGGVAVAPAGVSRDGQCVCELPNGRTGKINSCGQCVPKARKTNFLNGAALKRANRRRDGFVRLAKGALKGSGFKVVSASAGRSRAPARARKCSC